MQSRSARSGSNDLLIDWTQNSLSSGQGADKLSLIPDFRHQRHVWHRR